MAIPDLMAARPCAVSTVAILHIHISFLTSKPAASVVKLSPVCPAFADKCILVSTPYRTKVGSRNASHGTRTFLHGTSRRVLKHPLTNHGRYTNIFIMESWWIQMSPCGSETFHRGTTAGPNTSP